MKQDKSNSRKKQPNSHTRRLSERDKARAAWIAEKLREARMVVADVAHHSDHLVKLSCKVLLEHGESAEEREDARILLTIVEAKSFYGSGRGQGAGA